MLRDLAATEGVEAVSLTSPGALVGLGTVDWVETDCGQCLTGGMYVRFQDERAAHHVVSPDTFAVFGIPRREPGVPSPSRTAMPRRALRS